MIKRKWRRFERFEREVPCASRAGGVKSAAMTPNPFDQGARYVAKLDPPGFLHWLVRALTSPLEFHGWLDSRSIPFPGDPERICDTVAAIADTTSPGAWWALPLEFQTRPDVELFGRLLEYLGRLWRELRPPGCRRAALTWLQP
jgi:hypothetical protein